MVILKTDTDNTEISYTDRCICGSQKKKKSKTCGDKRCIAVAIATTNKERMESKYGSLSIINKANIEKAKAHNKAVYGVEYTLQNEEIRRRIYTTNMEKYGVKSTSQVPEVRAKQQATLMKNYGVQNFLQTEENWRLFYKKYDDALKAKIGPDYEFVERLKPYDYRIVHKTCGKEFIVNGHFCKDRCRRGVTLCIYCHPFKKAYSMAEREVGETVRGIYGGEIITNTWRIISPYELDIYIPEKKIAIEYCGDYWHANPKLYKADHIFKQKKRTAQDLWDQDKKKLDRCESIGIKLIVVWESDWKCDRENVIKIISSALDKTPPL